MHLEQLRAILNNYVLDLLRPLRTDHVLLVHTLLEQLGARSCFDLSPIDHLWLVHTTTPTSWLVTALARAVRRATSQADPQVSEMSVAFATTQLTTAARPILPLATAPCKCTLARRLHRLTRARTGRLDPQTEYAAIVHSQPRGRLEVMLHNGAKPAGNGLARVRGASSLRCSPRTLRLRPRALLPKKRAILQGVTVDLHC